MKLMCCWVERAIAQESEEDGEEKVAFYNPLVCWGEERKREKEREKKRRRKKTQKTSLLYTTK